MEMNAKEGERMNLIEYIEKESGMNCPEWLRETIERYATWSQTYSNMVKDAYSNMVEDAVGEVPYAKRTAETTQNVPNDDLIPRKAAIEIANDIRDCITVEGYWAWLERLKRLPSVQPDLSDYCDKLWKIAYERGKRETQPERKTGKWVGIKEYCDYLNEEAEREGKGNRYMPSGMNIHVYCNQCWESNDRRTTYCPHCGASMEGEQE